MDEVTRYIYDRLNGGNEALNNWKTLLDRSNGTCWVSKRQVTKLEAQRDLLDDILQEIKKAESNRPAVQAIYRVFEYCKAEDRKAGQCDSCQELGSCNTVNSSFYYEVDARAHQKRYGGRLTKVWWRHPDETHHTELHCYPKEEECTGPCEGCDCFCN